MYRVIVIAAVMALSSVSALPALGGVEETACNVCTCTSGDIVCLSAIGAEVIEEQSICNIACSEIGSTHGSRQFFEVPCAELAQCGAVGAPAIGQVALMATAFGLLAVGALVVRRARS